MKSSEKSDRVLVFSDLLIQALVSQAALRQQLLHQQLAQAPENRIQPEPLRVPEVRLSFVSPGDPVGWVWLDH